MRRPIVLAAVLAATFTAADARAGAFVIEGRGWGHGIGMSQYGAQGFALHGWSDRQILSHYYPGTTLGRVADQTIRVLVAQGRSRVRIASRRPYRLKDASGRAWTLRARRIVLTPGPRLRMNGRTVALALPLTIEPGARPLSVDGRPFRGSLTVVRGGGALSVVNAVRLELYLRGVVGWEMPHVWQAAALQAQTVAARSYALSVLHPSQDFDLYADTRDQMYGGIRAEYSSTDEAVAATSGEILLWQGHVARAYYSSTSGGRTQSLADAMPGLSEVPYLVSVSDPYDTLSPRHRWGPFRFSPQRVARLLHVPRPTRLRLERNASGRVATVDVRWRGGVTRVGGSDFQARLNLPSTWFSVEPTAAPRRSERRSSHRQPLPPGGWFVILRSAPVDGGPNGLRAVARAAHARLLLSAAYPGLRPGFWIVALGPYRSAGAAREAAGRLENRFPGAYARKIR